MHQMGLEKATSRTELTFCGPFLTRAAVEKICLLAEQQAYRSVVVPSSAITPAQHFLAEKNVKISCAIGFPNSSMDADVKRYETEVAIDNGAQEIEVLPSLANLREGDYKSVLRELRDIVEA